MRELGPEDQGSCCCRYMGTRSPVVVRKWSARERQRESGDRESLTERGRDRDRDREREGGREEVRTSKQ